MTDGNKDSSESVVAKLCRLASKGTPGTWAVTENDGSVAAFVNGKMIGDMGCTQWRYEDEALALEAVNALPDLLRVVEAVASTSPFHCRDGLRYIVCNFCNRASEGAEVDFEHAADCTVLLVRKLTGGTL